MAMSFGMSWAAAGQTQAVIRNAAARNFPRVFCTSGRLSLRKGMLKHGLKAGRIGIQSNAQPGAGIPFDELRTAGILAAHDNLDGTLPGGDKRSVHQSRCGKRIPGEVSVRIDQWQCCLEHLEDDPPERRQIVTAEIFYKVAADRNMHRRVKR